MFQAALAQAEELWDAAVVAGPASRPLPLFYCLSLAGRAVCAAWIEKGSSWVPSGHGLFMKLPATRQDVAGARLEVESSARGAFEMLARATDSETFEGTATIADLWASLPDFPATRGLWATH